MGADVGTDMSGRGRKYAFILLILLMNFHLGCATSGERAEAIYRDYLERCGRGSEEVGDEGVLCPVEAVTARLKSEETSFVLTAHVGGATLTQTEGSYRLSHDWILESLSLRVALIRLEAALHGRDRASLSQLFLPSYWASLMAQDEENPGWINDLYASLAAQSQPVCRIEKKRAICDISGQRLLFRFERLPGEVSGQWYAEKIGYSEERLR